MSLSSDGHGVRSFFQNYARAFQKKAWTCVGIWPGLGPQAQTHDVTYGFCSFIIDLVSVVYSLPVHLDQLRVKIVVTYKTLIILMHMDQQLQFHLQLLNVHLVCFLNLQNFRDGVELGYSHEFETWVMVSFTFVPKVPGGTRGHP